MSLRSGDDDFVSHFTILLMGMHRDASQGPAMVGGVQLTIFIMEEELKPEIVNSVQRS
jgi:hypothetical protein